MNFEEENAYFNPRSPHGERPGFSALRYQLRGISIHAPRTGSDAGGGVFRRALVISIHAPRTGSDGFASPSLPRRKYFNPRSPHGERLPSSRNARQNAPFQSTLPARGATSISKSMTSHVPFQSTLPARGATFWVDRPHGLWRISIHAPRTGSDCGIGRSTASPGHFNPRSPHGERHALVHGVCWGY